MNFQDFQKALDEYRSGEMPEAEAARIEAFMFENADARNAFEADEELRNLLRTSLSAAPTISPDRLQAVARRAMRQIEDEAAGAGVPESSARGKVARTSGWLSGLFAAFRQPQFAAAMAGVFIVGAAIGWGVRPSPPIDSTSSSTAAVVQPDVSSNAIAEAAPTEVIANTSNLIQPVSIIQKSAILDDLQSMKFDMMANGNAQQYQRLRQFEDQISNIIFEATPQPDGAADSMLAAYQAGETALMNGNAAEASALFQKVREQDKANMLGFLATMHLAKIAFDSGEDYARALRLYQSSLNDYPPQFISDRNKEDVQKRIELITRNSADDYRPLRLFNQAQNSKPDLARVHYEQLMSLYPNSTVAGEAVDQLLHFALDYPDKDLLPASDAMKIFIVFLEKFPESRLTPQVHVALGDLHLYRSQRTKQALIHYTTAMERNREKNPVIAATVKSRVQYMIDNGLMDH